VSCGTRDRHGFSAPGMSRRRTARRRRPLHLPVTSISPCARHRSCHGCTPATRSQRRRYVFTCRARRLRPTRPQSTSVSKYPITPRPVGHRSPCRHPSIDLLGHAVRAAIKTAPTRRSPCCRRGDRCFPTPRTISGRPQRCEPWGRPQRSAESRLTLTLVVATRVSSGEAVFPCGEAEFQNPACVEHLSWNSGVSCKVRGVPDSIVTP